MSNNPIKHDLGLPKSLVDKVNQVLKETQEKEKQKPKDDEK